MIPQCKQKRSIITARLTENYTIQENNTIEDIKRLSQYSKVGNKFNIENGCIKIGSGVRKVKVSCQATSKNESSVAQARIFTYVTKNTSNLSQESHYYNLTGEQISVSLAPSLINVNEGDIIFLRVYGNKDAKVMGGTSFLWTCITVEEIE